MTNLTTHVLQHKFFKGTLIVLLTTGCLSVATATSIAQPKAPEPDAEAEIVLGVIEDVQESLYVLGYLELSDVDGLVGGKTKQAVREFQWHNDFRVSGEITKQLHWMVTSIAFPSEKEGFEKVGAISWAQDLGWGISFGRYTYEVAHNSAVRRCERNSEHIEDCAQYVIPVQGNEWASLVNCGKRVAAAIGPTQENAWDNAVETAQRGGRGYCRELVSVNATFGVAIDRQERRLIEAYEEASAER